MEEREGGVGGWSVCVRVCACQSEKDLVRKRPVMYHFPFTKLPPASHVLWGLVEDCVCVCVCVGVEVERTKEGGC